MRGSPATPPTPRRGPRSLVSPLAPFARAAALALALVLLCASAAIAPALARADAALASDRAFDPSGTDWQGLAQFVRIAEVELGSGHAVAVTGQPLDLHGIQPADALVLVHPTRALDVGALEAFMRAGGRVIVLDDYGTGDELMTRFGIQRRPLPRRPAEMLRGKPALAIAEVTGDHPAVRDVGRVVTNHAVGLEQPQLAQLLVVRGDGEDDVTLAVAGTVGRGRLLALGDGSVFINAMLRYPGNRALATSLVRYALEDDAWGKRGGKLYVLANDFETTGTYGDESAFDAETKQITRALDDSLGSLRRDGLPPIVAYAAAIAVAAGVIVWAGARAGKTHKLVTPRFVREVPVVAQGGVAGHAAVLGAPGTSRALALLELKSALEEDLATRLGLPRTPPHEQIVARLRAAGLLDEAGARSLSRLLGRLAQVEARLAQPPATGVMAGASARAGRRGPGAALLGDAPSDREVLKVAAEVRELRQRLGLGAHDGA